MKNRTKKRFVNVNDNERKVENLERKVKRLELMSYIRTAADAAIEIIKHFF